MKKDRLYFFTMLATIAGYAWLAWNEKYSNMQENTAGTSLCLFRHVTGIPCPSCGTTHALLALSHLHIADAFYFNPIGFILAFAMLILPVWIIRDAITKQDSFYVFYRRLELLLSKRWVAIPFFVLIACNWIWNIYKYTS
ncbi:MAG: DUF2752 domain-containing protein [Bacteroidetes bacterium]|nr:DUF2752 domain-containing protein [Bacteroidota bacterium]